MPYKSTKIKIEKTSLDARRKLTEEDKKEMRKLREKQGLSQRELARMFGVSRRLVTMILDPEKEKRNKELRELRGGSKKYYNKEKHAEYMRTHRRRKQQLLKEGKITLENDEQISDRRK